MHYLSSSLQIFFGMSYLAQPSTSKVAQESRWELEERRALHSASSNTKECDNNGGSAGKREGKKEMVAQKSATGQRDMVAQKSMKGNKGVQESVQLLCSLRDRAQGSANVPSTSPLLVHNTGSTQEA